MFTYGYIVEATMAHLDIDETEAQSMHLLDRFHIFANEAMQAICASKPMYKYIDVTVVKEFDPLVVSTDGSSLIPATEYTGTNPVAATEAETLKYYHDKNIYKINEVVSMSDTFINFAEKERYIITKRKPTLEEILYAEATGVVLTEIVEKNTALRDTDFSYISKNQLTFYKAGEFLIPAKFVWYRFDSGISSADEIDMPEDILMTIPIYIASKCLEIDNMQKAQVLRNQFEVALSRCTSGDFMTVKRVPSSW